MTNKPENENQILSYTQKLSLMAGSVSALYLLPSQAEAAVIYKTDSFSVTPGSNASVEWDVDGVNGNEFVLQNYSNGGNSFISLNSFSRNARGMVQEITTNSALFNNLAAGFVVGPTLASGFQFGPAGQNYRSVLFNSTMVGYPFKGGVIGSNFIGFKFDSASNTRYGWAELTLTSNSVTINRWAYEDSGAAIAVGQTSSSSQSVPEPSSSLGLLGLGAAGVLRWKKRRQVEVAKEENIAA